MTALSEISLPASPAEKLAWLAARFADGSFSSPTEAALVAALVCCHNSTTGLICPATDTLARRIGAGRRSVEGALRDLAADGRGVIRRRRRFGRTTVYGLVGLGSGRAPISANPAEMEAANRQSAPVHSGKPCRSIPANSAGHNLLKEPIKETGRGAADGDFENLEYGGAWSRILDLVEVEGELGREAVGRWLRSAELVAVDGDAIQVRVGSRYAADWVQARYELLIARAAERVLGLSRVVVEIEAPAGAPRHADMGAARPAPPRRPSAPRSSVPAPPATAGRVAGAGRPIAPRPAPAGLPGAAGRVLDSVAGGDRLGLVPSRSPSVWSPLVPGGQA